MICPTEKLNFNGKVFEDSFSLAFLALLLHCFLNSLASTTMVPVDQASQAVVLPHSPPFAPTTPAPLFFEQDHHHTKKGFSHQDLLPPLDQIQPPTSPNQPTHQHPSILSAFHQVEHQSDRPNLLPALIPAVSTSLPSPSCSSSNNTVSGSNSSSSSSVYSSAKTIIKPPPISFIPSLRRSSNQAQPSISAILNQDPESNLAGRRLELEERSDWDTRTGRSDALAMRLNPNSTGLPFLRDGGRDRWGNRWGIENHVLSPVIR